MAKHNVPAAHRSNSFIGAAHGRRVPGANAAVLADGPPHPSPQHAIECGSVVVPDDARRRALLSGAVRDRLAAEYHHHHADIDTFWGVYRFLNTTIGISVSPPRLESILGALRLHLQDAPTANGSSPRSHSTPPPTPSNSKNSTTTSQQQPVSCTILTVAQLEHVVGEIMFGENDNELYGDDDRALLALAIRGEHALLFPQEEERAQAARGGSADDDAAQSCTRGGCGKATPSSLVQGVLSSIQANLRPYLMAKRHSALAGPRPGAPETASAAPAAAAAPYDPTADVVDLDSVWRHLTTAARQKTRPTSNAVHNGQEGQGGRGLRGPSNDEVLQALFHRIGGSASMEDPSSDSASQCTGGRSSLHGGNGSIFDSSPMRGGSLSKVSSMTQQKVRKSFMHALDFSRADGGASPHAAATSGDGRSMAPQLAGGSGGASAANIAQVSSSTFGPVGSVTASDDGMSPLQSPTDPFERMAAFPVDRASAATAPAAAIVRQRSVSLIDVADSTEELLRGARAMMDSDGTTAFGNLLQPGELKQVEQSLGGAEQRRASLLSKHESVLDLFEQRKRTTRLSSLNNGNGEHRVSVVSFFLDGIPTVAEDGRPADSTAVVPPALSLPANAASGRWKQLQASVADIRASNSTGGGGGGGGVTDRSGASSSALCSARSSSTADRDRPSSSASFFIKNAKQRAALTKAEKFLLQSKRMTNKTLDKQIRAFDDCDMPFLAYDTNKEMVRRRAELMLAQGGGLHDDDVCSVTSSSINVLAAGARGKVPNHNHHCGASSPSSVSSFPSVHRHVPNRREPVAGNRRRLVVPDLLSASPSSPTSSCKSLQCLTVADGELRAAQHPLADVALASPSPLWGRWTSGGRGL